MTDDDKTSTENWVPKVATVDRREAEVLRRVGRRLPRADTRRR